MHSGAERRPVLLTLLEKGCLFPRSSHIISGGRLAPSQATVWVALGSIGLAPFSSLFFSKVNPLTLLGERTAEQSFTTYYESN